ncbi:MAG TPA: type II toxin-antitoxin system death-on-curing family toxin [Rhizomicrobium sp.]
MLGFEPKIEAEFLRVSDGVADEDLGPQSLSTHDVLKAHYLVANHFYQVGQGMGGMGPRDMGLLQSAVYRQVASFQGQLKWQNLFDTSATLFFGLIKDHPFYDANKRTAFLCVLLQLYKSGWCPSIPAKELEDFTVEIAENGLSKHQRFKALKDRESDPEIRFISWYLRKNTRRMDRNFYAVTYNQLQTILNRFDYALANPRGNHIDVVKVRIQKPFLGIIGSTKEVHIKLGQIGFPRWTAEVGKGAIKTVRQITNLTHEDGVDSASFFKGLDTLQSLITSYHDPLMRLAER